MTNKIITLKDEFDKIWQKLQRGENFAFLRYGDGERSIILGKSVKAQEGWVSPNYVSRLGEDLLETLNKTDDRIYYGISCPCCDSSAYYWYKTRVENKNITFANLFVNCNYKKFIENFEKINREAVFIGNFRAENKPVGNLKILKYYNIGDDCISFWENQAGELLEKIKSDFKDRNDLLYVVSAGPMSEPIIVDLFNNNQNNCYIDFGSAIDKYVHEAQTRPYMDENTVYAKSNCWMYNPVDTSFDVSVVLNLYKRPENLELQLKAIENQTLKPKEILLFKDGVENGPEVEFPQELKNRFKHVEISEKNCGVWGRFKFAQKALSKYVCVFDDDTIPGERWLENCHKNMVEQEGLYGTIGIVFEEPEKYSYSGFYRVGWDGNLDKAAQVDFVGHSWFFQKYWLEFLFNGTEELQKFKTAAEDMTFSAQLQKHGIKTFTPPHPFNNHSLWGSLPEFATKLGTSNGALSLTSSNLQKMNEAINVLLKRGWKPLIEANSEYVKALKKELIMLSNLNQKKKIKIPKGLKAFLKKVIKKSKEAVEFGQSFFADLNSEFRELEKLGFITENQEISLYVTHLAGGGTEFFFENETKDIESLILVLRPYRHGLYQLIFQKKDVKREVIFKNIEKLKSLLEKFKTVEIIVNNLFGYREFFKLINILSSLKNKGKVVSMIHDYYSICPSTFLVDKEDKFCNLPTADVCEKCFKEGFDTIKKVTKKFKKIDDWRKIWSDFYNDLVDEIVVFSESSENILTRIYPEIKEKIIVKPHNPKSFAPLKFSKQEEGIKIVFLGNIDQVYKGKKIVTEMAEIVQKQGLDNVKLTVVGEYSEKNSVEVTGKYSREELRGVLLKVKPDLIFIPSICPETFSYTLSEAISTGLKVACFDVGALPERVKKYPKGLVISSVHPQTALEEIIDFVSKK